ncbi:MAG: hypothetical protein JKY50_10450 [Oleispira sp.]|nr:hypothetical protein [Oleispira sp.]
MLKIIISCAILIAASSGQANLHNMNATKMDKDDSGYINPIEPLKSKAFSQHVAHFCLNQVEGFGLDRKFMTAYVVECAADYGVFNIVLKSY